MESKPCLSSALVIVDVVVAMLLVLGACAAAPSGSHDPDTNRGPVEIIDLYLVAWAGQTAHFTVGGNNKRYRPEQVIFTS